MTPEAARSSPAQDTWADPAEAPGDGHAEAAGAARTDPIDVLVNGNAQCTETGNAQAP